MTFAIFILLVLGLFIALLNLLPAMGTLGFDADGAISLLISFMRAWDIYFPMRELLLCVGIMITFEVAVWVWHIGWSVTKFIRGHGSA